MNLWFISDTHFWHKNIIEYCERPFGKLCVEEMNEAIIENWNSVVGDDDVVYHLGDFSFGSLSKSCDILARLRGRKFLVYGNHDRGFIRKERFQKHWEWIKPYYRLKAGTYNGQDTTIILFHFPIACWDEQGQGSWHLHGHSHGSYVAQGKILDVGLDGPFRYEQFGPIHIDKVKEYMDVSKVVVNDGHKNREV